MSNYIKGNFTYIFQDVAEVEGGVRVLPFSGTMPNGSTAYWGPALRGFDSEETGRNGGEACLFPRRALSSPRDEMLNTA